MTMAATTTTISEEELESDVVRRTVINLACAQEKKHDAKEGAQVGLSSS
jgi:hypothetical protein